MAEVARLDIIIRNQQAVRATQQVSAGLDRMGTAAVRGTAKATTAFGRLKTSTFSTRTALTGLGGLFVIRGIVNTLRGFEDAMAGVEAVTGATTDEFEALNKEARRLGATTAFQAKEAAEGMRFLGQAGFDVNEILAATEPALRLAQAGMLSLGEAADIVSNIMSGFQIEANRTAEVADVMAVVAASANTNIRQMGNAMKFVAPLAAVTGQSVRDMAAAVGVLGDAGLQGSLAGTGLRQSLLKLTNVTPQAKQRIKDLGLTLAELNPETNSFIDVIDRLAQSEFGAGDAAVIFGARAATAITTLTSAVPRLRELREAVEASGGALNEMAGIMEDTLSGSIKQFISVLQEATLQVGDAGLSGAIRGTIDTLTGLFRVFTNTLDPLDQNAQLYRRMAIAVQLLAAALAGLAIGRIVGGLFTMIGAVQTSIIAIRAATASQIALNVAMLASPITLIAGAVALATAAYFTFRGSARDATVAADAFNVAMDSGHVALRNYATAAETANEQLADLSKTQLATALLRLQLELENTTEDLEELTDDAVSAFRKIQVAQGFLTFSGGGGEAFLQLTTDLKKGFEAGAVSIEEVIEKLIEFEQTGQQGASSARALAVALLEEGDQLLDTADRAESLRKQIDFVTQAQAGTLTAAELAAGRLGVESDAVARLAEKLENAGRTLEEFEETARLSGLTAGEKQIEQIIAARDEMIEAFQPVGEGETFQEFEQELIRVNAAAQTLIANINAGDTGKSRFDEVTEAVRKLKDEFDPAAAAAREFLDIEQLLAEAQQLGIGTATERAGLLERARAEMDALQDPFGTMISNLERETELARLSNEEREIQNQLFAAEADLRKQGVELTDEQSKALENQLRVLQGTQDAFEEGARLTEALKTPTEKYADELLRLDELLVAAAISQETFTRAAAAAEERLKEATEATSSAAKVFADEAARESFRSFSDFLFNPFEDGLKGMLSAFADTLREMAANALAKQIFSSLSGIGAGGGNAFLSAVGSFFGAGVADDGGRGQAGQPVLIGTGAQPEAFIPDSAGTFVPQQQMGAMAGAGGSAAPPQVNVAAPQVIVVDSAEKAEQLLQSAKGEEAVLSILRNNPQATRGAIGA